jgi:hypothetical protein
MPRYLRETLRLLDFRSEEAVGQLAGRAPRFITTGVPRSDGFGPLRWWWFRGRWPLRIHTVRIDGRLAGQRSHWRELAGKPHRIPAFGA